MLHIHKIVFCVQGMAKDLMFLLTNKYNAMILECQTVGDNMEIITKAQGNVQVTMEVITLSPGKCTDNYGDYH